MKLTKVLLTVVVAASLFFVSCGPKDADIKASVDTAIKADPMFSGASADVKDGVVTITGEMKDAACKDMCAKKIKEIKGVKSIVDNATIAPPPAPPVAPPASMTTALDEATQQKVKDGLKDIKGVTVTFEGDKAVLVGEVSKADNMKIAQMLAAAKVQSDKTKLVVKP